MKFYITANMWLGIPFEFLLHCVPKHRMFLDHWAITELIGGAEGPACQIDGKNSTYPGKHLIKMRIWNSAINCQNY